MEFTVDFGLLNDVGEPNPNICTCIKGEGKPTAPTEDMIGCFYMDTLTGNIYKCSKLPYNYHRKNENGDSVDYDWKDISSFISEVVDDGIFDIFTSTGIYIVRGGTTGTDVIIRKQSSAIVNNKTMIMAQDVRFPIDTNALVFVYYSNNSLLDTIKTRFRIVSAKRDTNFWLIRKTNGDGTFSETVEYILDADQTYNPKSENPQSGKAVAEAVADKSTVYYGTEITREMFDEEPNKNIIIKTTRDSNSVFSKVKAGDIYNYRDTKHFGDNAERCAFLCLDAIKIATSNANGVQSVSHTSYWTILERPYVCQEYTADSPYAQSGIAVKEAIGGAQRILTYETYSEANEALSKLDGEVFIGGIVAIPMDETVWHYNINKSYKLLSTEPTDWQENYRSYYTHRSADDYYMQLYYGSCVPIEYNYVQLTKEPANWSTNYRIYFYYFEEHYWMIAALVDGGYMQASDFEDFSKITVYDEIPIFKENTFYTYVLTVGERLATVNYVDATKITVDQTYNPESENPQSGKAVAEAVKDIPTIFTGEELKWEMYDVDTNAIQKTAYKDSESDSVFWKANTGDIYINTAQKVVFVCAYNMRMSNPSTVAPNTHNLTYWVCLKHYPVTHFYNPESTIPLTGVAVNKALESFYDKEISPINLEMANLKTLIGDIDTALDEIIALQNAILGGE